MWTEPKRPRLEAAELHQLKWLLGTLLGLLAAWTVPHMEIAAWPWLLLITVAAGLVLWRPGLGARLPRAVHRLAFPVILAVAALDGLLTQDILPPLVRLTLMLILYRMVEPRQRRDDLQLALMGLFLVVVAGVLSVSVAFVGQILLFTGCALLFLLTITLAGAAGPVPTSVRPDWLALARRVRAATDWRVALLGGGLFAGLVAASATFFLLLPRFELGNSLFFEKLMKGKDRTGFSETVKLGSVTDIQDDDGVAFRVEVSDTTQVPAAPYWRMLVLDKYENGGFGMSPALKNKLTVPVKISRFIGPRTDGSPNGVPQWKFYFEPGVSRYLPLPGDFYRVVLADPHEVRHNRTLRLAALERHSPRMLGYLVEEVVLSRYIIEFTQDEPNRPVEVRNASGEPDYLGLPIKPDEVTRLRAWAAEIGVTDGDADEFARRAGAWLGQRHGYALQVKLPGDPEADPIVRWLDSDLSGHCEFFAGAFVLLARAAGFEARMAVGFRGGLWNPLSGNFVVRNSNAHAWAEILDARESGRRRWSRVDPTAGADALGERTSAQVGEAALRQISDSGWGARLDSLRMFWYRRVVSFDKETRAEVAKTVKESVEKLGRGLRGWMGARGDELRAWAARPWDWQRLVAWAGIVAVAIAFVRGWRAARLVWLRRRGGDPVRREAGIWLARLAARHVDESVAVRPALERLRYGAAASWPDPAVIFREARRVARAARKT